MYVIIMMRILTNACLNHKLMILNHRFVVVMGKQISSIIFYMIYDWLLIKLE